MLTSIGTFTQRLQRHSATPSATLTQRERITPLWVNIQCPQTHITAGYG
ncbi:hypothetical protein VC116063_002374 [Vibrio cholerae O1 str. 116063]|nr:hypothetical protein VC116063_002374 [Vibrio cholerae O1 str. 116063]